MFSNNAYANDTVTVTQPTQQVPVNTTDSVQSGFISTIVPILLIFLVFYFLLIRPQEKKRQAHEDLVKTVKKGEEIVTTSGIYGTVVNTSDVDDTITLEIADNVNIKISKAAIADIKSRKLQDTSLLSKKNKKR